MEITTSASAANPLAPNPAVTTSVPEEAPAF